MVFKWRKEHTPLTGARIIQQTRMFVECKIEKLQKPKHSGKGIGGDGEAVKYS
jgi:hypothetical protein